MIDLEENKRFLLGLQTKIKELSSTLQISKLQQELAELEKQTLAEDFWNDSQKSSMIYTKMNKIQKKIKTYENLRDELDNLIELNELLIVENDPNLEKDLISSTQKFQNDLDEIEIQTLFSGKYDANNSIVTIHPGAGGTESQDWAEMLYRMYTRWAAANGFSVKELDYLDGEEAGLKSVTFLVSGENSYGYLKSENGVHRLVRISPFDSGGRRHTSFASVEVLPEITEDAEIEINLDDVRIDVYRSSGAGGQHLNKTSSAIRMVHIPTNTVVTCQSERSQLQNRETAMKMLKSKLLVLKEKEEKEKMANIKGEEKDIGWRKSNSLIRFLPIYNGKRPQNKLRSGKCAISYGWKFE